MYSTLGAAQFKSGNGMLLEIVQTGEKRCQAGRCKSFEPATAALPRSSAENRRTGHLLGGEGRRGKGLPQGRFETGILNRRESKIVPWDWCVWDGTLRCGRGSSPGAAGQGGLAGGGSRRGQACSAPALPAGDLRCGGLSRYVRRIGASGTAPYAPFVHSKIREGDPDFGTPAVVSDQPRSASSGKGGGWWVEAAARNRAWMNCRRRGTSMIQ